ncbi:MAG: hypothetical protein AAF717_01670 [Bacteroidota bacterium]
MIILLFTIFFALGGYGVQWVTTENQILPKVIPGELFTTSQEVADNTFKKSIEQMEEIRYFIKAYKEPPVEDHFFVACLERLNRYLEVKDRETEPPIDFSGIKQVRRAKVKSDEEIGASLYPRAMIESWECYSQQDAIVLLQRIDTIRARHPWDVVSKSPITYFRKNNEIVFITPGGFYMLDRVPEIEDFLRTRL